MQQPPQPAPQKPATTTDTSAGQGTLAGASGTLIGAGVSELQTNIYAGMILILVGALLAVYRARLIVKFPSAPSNQLFAPGR